LTRTHFPEMHSSPAVHTPQLSILAPQPSAAGPHSRFCAAQVFGVHVCVPLPHLFGTGGCRPRTIHRPGKCRTRRGRRNRRARSRSLHPPGIAWPGRTLWRRHARAKVEDHVFEQLFLCVHRVRVALRGENLVVLVRVLDVKIAEQHAPALQRRRRRGQVFHAIDGRVVREMQRDFQARVVVAGARIGAAAIRVAGAHLAAGLALLVVGAVAIEPCWV